MDSFSIHADSFSIGLDSFLIHADSFSIDLDSFLDFFIVPTVLK